MKIRFIPGHALAVHIDGQLAGVITKPGASISPDDSGYYEIDSPFQDLLKLKESEPDAYISPKDFNMNIHKEALCFASWSDNGEDIYRQKAFLIKPVTLY